MAENITAQIILDLYNDNFVSINAKQGDKESRYIEVTVTESGLPYFISSSTMMAFVRCGKPDGTYVFSNTVITDRGTILIELEEQMLAVCGQCRADITIATIYTLKEDEIVLVADIETINDGQGNISLDLVTNSKENLPALSTTSTSILSTMSFFINVTSNPLNGVNINSLPEYSALNDAIVKMSEVEFTTKKFLNDLKITEENIKILENEISSAEESRINAENLRLENEDDRLSAESIRLSNEEKRIRQEQLRIDAENERIEAERNRETNIANVIQRAEKAATDCEGIVNGSGFIPLTDKGIASGVATLDSTGKIPSTQLKIVDNIESEDTTSMLSANQGRVLDNKILAVAKSLSMLQNKVGSLHNVWSGTEDPNTNDGSDGQSANGDIYMQIINE